MGVTDRPSVRGSAWIYRVLLRLYPRGFRSRFAEELEASFRDVCTAVLAERGWFGLLRLWFFTFWDLLGQSALERMGVARSLRAGARAGARGGRVGRGFTFMDSIWQDLRYAVRSLSRVPAFTAVVIATLALGIGANTAIFSVVDGVVLRPLPYDAPHELIVLRSFDRRSGGDSHASHPDFLDWREMNETFAGMAATIPWAPTLTGRGDATRLTGQSVTSDFFGILRTPVQLGRLFAASDADSTVRTVVLSYRIWQNLFSGAASAVGATLVLNGDAYTVVGVLAAEARHPFAPEADVFRAYTPTRESRDLYVARVVGRLRPDRDLAAAAADLAGIASRLEAEYPETNTEKDIRLVPLREWIVGDVTLALYVLLVAVGFVLLIAAVNVANLFLARATARTGEFAVRAALGAGRTRLVRQLLTESLLIAALGGLAGFALAAWGTGGLLALAPGDIPRLDAVRVDVRVLGFTAAATLAASIIFGLAPAVRAARTPLVEAIGHDGRRGGGSRSGQRTRRWLVSLQVSIALVLLVGSGLLIRSFNRLTHEDVGFDAGGVLTARMNLANYDGPGAYDRFYNDLLDRLDARPETEAVGGVMWAPFSGSLVITSFEIAGRPAPLPNQSPNARLLSATPDYFRTVGMTLVAGRDFEGRDRVESTPVAIINQAAADQYWPDTNPIGQRITLGLAFDRDEAEREIIGVVSNTRLETFGEEIDAQVYVPYAQFRTSFLTVVARTGGDPLAFAPTLRAEAGAIDPAVPVTDVRAFDQMVRSSVAEDRFYTMLLTIFAASALVLGAVGLYGVLSFGVAQRSAEIGIRMALGAARRDVLRHVVADGLRLVAIGLGAGLVLAALTTRLLRGLLHEVSATDPFTYAGTVALLVVVALAACYFPARRAGRIAPGAALR